MKILVTGSSGFVGKHLVKKLPMKYQIIRYDLKNGQDILNERLLLNKLKEVDVVIHLAAFISAEESWKKPKEYFINNALGTLSVVQNSIEAGVKKIIYFSSAAVKAEPLTPYALSKIAGENFVKLYSKDIKTIIVRPENIYGPGQKQEYGYVIHNFIKAIKSDHNVQIYGDGLQIRDFIYVDDVISVVEQFIKEDVSNKLINLGTGKGTSIKELCTIIGNIMEKKPNINYLQARNEPRKSVAETGNLERIGISSSRFVDLNKGVEKLIKDQYSNL